MAHWSISEMKGWYRAGPTSETNHKTLCASYEDRSTPLVGCLPFHHVFVWPHIVRATRKSHSQRATVFWTSCILVGFSTPTVCHIFLQVLRSLCCFITMFFVLPWTAKLNREGFTPKRDLPSQAGQRNPRPCCSLIGVICLHRWPRRKPLPCQVSTFIRVLVESYNSFTLTPDQLDKVTQQGRMSDGPAFRF